jgi:serine/threonine-protein kinase
VIAKAPATVTVPDVRLGTASAGKQTLQLAGFSVHTAPKDVTDPAQNNIVISQSPAGNTQAKKGATVTIVVGHYKPTSTTPTTPTTTTPTTTT